MIGFTEEASGRLPVPRFEVGQIVRHRRYGYRGVIVDYNLQCQADDAWYLNNQTQPDRNQPWYHVMVDGSAATTYAAESNLRLDDHPAPIEHPLLEDYFTEFEEGRYRRNDKPWP